LCLRGFIRLSFFFVLWRVFFLLKSKQSGTNCQQSDSNCFFRHLKKVIAIGMYFLGLDFNVK
jgi:hypothetical protein